MLRILKSIIMIAVVSAVAVGATGAYFTDQDVVTENTFASGNINMTVSPQSKGVNVSNMAPGQWVKSATFTAYNQSSITESLQWKVSDSLVSQSLGGFYGNLNVSVWAKGLGYDQNSKLAPDGSMIEAQNVWDGKLRDLDYQFKDMPQNRSANVWFFVQLDKMAGNVYQNQNGLNIKILHLIC